MTSSDAFSERVRRYAERLVESREAAIAGLFDLTATRLLRFATAITRNQHDAEDALQTALVKVAADGKKLLHAEQPWPYLLKMVRNESLLVLRRRKNTRLQGDASDLLIQVSVDERPSEETYRQIWLALRELPREQSEVVVLKIWEELTFAEIAELLDTSLATAASRYRYALQKLELKFRTSAAEVRS